MSQNLTLISSKDGMLLPSLTAHVEGLLTRPESGRKSILRAEDSELFKAQVKASRQKISLAQLEFEASLGMSFSASTL